MTTFRGPFNIKDSTSLQSDTTVMSVDNSALSINVPTTAETTAHSSADALLQITANGSIYYIPAYTSG